MSAKQPFFKGLMMQPNKRKYPDYNYEERQAQYDLVHTQEQLERFIAEEEELLDNIKGLKRSALLDVAKKRLMSSDASVATNMASLSIFSLEMPAAPPSSPVDVSSNLTP